MEQARFEQARGGPTVWTRLKHWFYSARLPGWVRGQMRLAAARNAALGAGPRPFHWDALDYFERNLRRILELASESGAQVVVFSTPPSSLLTLYGPEEPPRASYWIRDAQTTQMYRDSLSVRMQSMVAMEAARGTSVAFVSHGVLPPTLFLDDAHLTPEGNRRVADDFSSALEPWLAPAAGDRER